MRHSSLQKGLVPVLLLVVAPAVAGALRGGFTDLFAYQYSDAKVAETSFASIEHPVTARLVVRRVRDQNRFEELFPVWRHHPFFTNSDEPTREEDLTGATRSSRAVFDLIDGPPSPSSAITATGSAEPFAASASAGLSQSPDHRERDRASGRRRDSGERWPHAPLTVPLRFPNR